MVFGALILAASAAQPALAAQDDGVVHLQTAQARKLTVQAVQALDQGREDYARSLVIQSKDPLAYKIYDWMLFTTMKSPKWDVNLFMRLARFVKQNPDWPSISKIELLAENVMPQDLPVTEVLAWFDDNPPHTPAGMERYMDAMIIRGRGDDARTFLAQWWASTLTSRDQQREIFRKFGGYLTLAAHKARFDALLRAGNYDNARAIAQVLEQGYPQLAEARIALAEGKTHGIDAYIDRVPSYLQNDPGLLYERLHWRRVRDMDKGAIEILRMKLPVDKIKNKKAWWGERHIMIRRLLEKHDYKGAYDLASRHIQDEGFAYAQAQWITGWLALRYMHKPTEAYERFTSLYSKVSTPISQARAAYWCGRAAEAMGNKKLAQGWYVKAAPYKTTFYGQLALAKVVSQPDLPKDTISSLSHSEKNNYERHELVQAAQIFRLAGMGDMSARFMQAFIARENTPKAYKFAATVMADMGDYNEALRIAKDASARGYFMTRQSYPVMTDWIEGATDVEMALTHAFVRQESMFDPQAVSHAGARGLMQLMPYTAREIASKINVTYDKQWLTEKPQYNVRLGTAYVEKLLEKYGGNYPLAIAAYNAGPSNVDQWIDEFGDPRDRDVDLIDWIEMIPVYETRNYVQRVLENVFVYRLRLKDIQKQPHHAVHVAFQGDP